MNGISLWKQGLLVTVVAAMAAVVPAGAEAYEIIDSTSVTRVTQYGDQSSVPDAPTSLTGTHTGWTWTGTGANYQPTPNHSHAFDTPIGRVNGNATWDVHQRGYGMLTGDDMAMAQFYGGVGLGWSRTSPTQHGLKWISTKTTFVFSIARDAYLDVDFHLASSAVLTEGSANHNGFSWNRTEIRFEGPTRLDGYVSHVDRVSSLVDSGSAGTTDDDELDGTYSYFVPQGIFTLTLETIAQVNLPQGGSGGVWNRSGFMTYPDPTPDMNWEVSISVASLTDIINGRAAAVPEPASALVFGGLASGLALLRRRA